MHHKLTPIKMFFLQLVALSAFNHLPELILFSEFGGKVITMKPIVKSLQKLLEHQDKTVREEVNSLRNRTKLRNKCPLAQIFSQIPSSYFLKEMGRSLCKVLCSVESI